MITGRELIDLVIMTGALGFIFMDSFKKPREEFEFHLPKRFDWEDFLYACSVVAPCIILHEMAHKFVALGFGLKATFHAAYEWLALGMFLKVINFGFIFFVPGYVRVSGMGTNLEFFLIAFSGPLVHLILWLGTKEYIRKARAIPKKRLQYLGPVMHINKFLFIFNMLPIPGFDGFSVYKNLIGIFF